MPVLGLALLLAAPDADVHWEHHPSHFWLVLGGGATSAVLAYATGGVARSRGDARLFLVSLAFLAAAGFLGLHALATPGVLLETPNPGFAIATPVGLLLSRPCSRPPRRCRTAGARTGGDARRAAPTRRRWWWRWRCGESRRSARVPPLDDPTPVERASGRW